jgi:hypothetical protein
MLLNFLKMSPDTSRGEQCAMQAKCVLLKLHIPPILAGEKELQFILIFTHAAWGRLRGLFYSEADSKFPAFGDPARSISFMAMVDKSTTEAAAIQLN